MTTFTDAFTRSLLRHAESDPRIVAITAAMAGPTGLLPFEARFPDRFVDVGIAEQHAVTAAAGMAMAGMRPVVAVYSTFFTRAFDQANLDVGLHRLPVVMVLDRAGITGDDGPSHHGVLDMALALSIPGMTVFAPSSAPEVEVMLTEALTLDGPSIIRFPKTPAPRVPPGTVGSGLHARRTRAGRRIGVPPGRREDARRGRGGGGGAGARRDRSDRLGCAGGVGSRSGHARRRRPSPGGDHRRGRCPPWRGRHVRGRRSPQLDRVPARPLRSSRSGRPRSFIAQGKPDRILAGLGLDGPGLARSAREALRRLRRSSLRGSAPASPPASLPATVITNDALD